MANRLLNEKSPYLQQHAHNPVDWYPWGEGAFAKARSEQKPIFLSVGYSTCHWCHVMEKESFENETIAGLLNEHFVPVKVDREERPDVDRIYMSSLQAMGQDGGWPMSIFLTPELKPFWGGTYFPPESRHGRTGFPDILRRIHDVWSSERSRALEAGESLTGYLGDISRAKLADRDPSSGVIALCFEQLEKTYDPECGGFGRGPKFPRPASLDFLLRYSSRTGSGRAGEMVRRTLSSMAGGGMYDQIGGGFHRYSVDREWRLPHFEKMLYDQAQLLSLYSSAYRHSGHPEDLRIVRETADYVLRELTSPDGGFYSAEDADSPRPENPDESGEGACYLWTLAEIKAALEDDAPVFVAAYGILAEGNAPFDPQREFVGRNIPYCAATHESVAEKLRLDPSAVRSTLERARGVLLKIREFRPRPQRDDKILTSWNGLMISGFTDAYAVLEDGIYRRTAERAAEFVLRHLRDRSTGLLMRRYRNSEVRQEGFLDDYAFVVKGLIDLYEITGTWAWLRDALTLTEMQIRLFRDESGGGFFDTTGTDQSILVRMKEQHDGAEPAGNSITACNLIRLGRATGRAEWVALARDIFRSFRPMLEKQPVALPAMITALDFSTSAAAQVVLAGNVEDPASHELRRQITARYLPHLSILYADGGEGQAFLSAGIPALGGMSTIDGKPAAYVCRDFVCALPTGDPAHLSALLDAL